ncbi:hypothetical protein TNCV_967741 [Trichonephila clavipes]|nr:hypothetical protein TNCV_967741 [Trichonephila clavipes]
MELAYMYRVFLNLTNQFRIGIIGTMEMTTYRWIWGRKRRLVCENHDKSSRWEEDGPGEERGQTNAES